jgi:hypothetical protein
MVYFRGEPLAKPVFDMIVDKKVVGEVYENRFKRYSE